MPATKRVKRGRGSIKARSAGAREHAGVSDAAVEKRTGKRWGEWFALLDRAGAKELEHPAIARLLHEQHRVDGWWAQMITVAWEQARGRRVKHERPDGFQVSASRTIDAGAAEVWKALTDEKRRMRWLKAPKWEVRTQKASQRLRVAWTDGTLVEFRLYPKPAGRCQIVAQHMKLKDAKTADWTKSCWSRALDRMGAVLAR